MLFLAVKFHYIIKQSELPMEVRKFKDTELPFPLIQFEDARIEMKHFFTKYQFKPWDSYKNDYQLFLIHCLRSQVSFFHNC